jgi:hypothetical protein
MRQRSTYQNRCRLTAFAFLLASCVRWCFASRRGYSDTHSGRQSLSPHQNSFPSKDLRIQLPYWRSTRPRVPKQHRPGFTKTPELCSILPANDVSSTRWKMACNRSINPIHLFAEFFLTALEGCRRPRPAVSSSFCSQHPALTLRPIVLSAGFRFLLPPGSPIFGFLAPFMASSNSRSLL